jgi:hypothetical protein
MATSDEGLRPLDLLRRHLQDVGLGHRQMILADPPEHVLVKPLELDVLEVRAGCCRDPR